MKKNYMEKIILAVDDAPSIRLIVESLFKDQHQVVLKQSAEDALSWLQEGNFPDIIISDIKMPGMSGMEFMQQLKASGYFKGIPVLILSSNDNSSDRIKYLGEGAEDFLVKPFNPAELRLRVDHILKRFDTSYPNVG